MATSVYSSAADLRECAVCLDDMLEKKPKFLDCKHSYCMPCLSGLAKVHGTSGLKVPCPKCKHNTYVKSGNLSDLPDNFLLQEVKAIIDDHTRYNYCFYCNIQDREVRAVSQCISCHRYMCRECLEKHERAFKNHEIMQILTDKDQKQAYCKKHNALVVYACLACSPVNLFCDACIMIDTPCHPTKELVEFTAALSQEKTNLKSKLEQQLRVENSVSEVDALCNKELSVIRETVSIFQDTIKTTAAEITSLAEKAYNINSLKLKSDAVKQFSQIAEVLVNSDTSSLDELFQTALKFTAALDSFSDEEKKINRLDMKPDSAARFRGFLAEILITELQSSISKVELHSRGPIVKPCSEILEGTLRGGYIFGEMSHCYENWGAEVKENYSLGMNVEKRVGGNSLEGIWNDGREVLQRGVNQEKRDQTLAKETIDTQIGSSNVVQNMPQGEVKSPGEGKGGKKRQRKWKKIDAEVRNQQSEGKKIFREPVKKSNFETPTDNAQPEKRISRWSEPGRDRSPRSYSRGRDWNVYAHETGEKFSLFFGWQNPLSQHHPARFEIEGVKYNCTRQYMMSQKAVMFRDPEMLKRIMSTNDPEEQKRCGRQVQGFDVDVWEQHCWDVVEKANMAKFSQDEKLKKAIFDTAGTTLVEASPWDQKWGIGLKATDSRVWNRDTWDGENWLGQILTAVRDMLMAQEGYPVAASALNSYKECKQKAQSGQRSDILTTPKKGRSSRGTSARGRQQYEKPVVVISETGENITLFFGRNNPLSQFYQASVQIDGYTYNCAEQYVMYQKAALFEDYDTADQIMEKLNPREQERCGERIKGFKADKWDQYAWNVLETANMQKFSQNQELKKVLFATAGTTLAEASPFDRKWGIGLKADDPRACNSNTWLGENWLGQVLMTVRDQLMAMEGYA